VGLGVGLSCLLSTGAVWLASMLTKERKKTKKLNSSGEKESTTEKRRR
jgi:fucose permease